MSLNSEEYLGALGEELIKFKNTEQKFVGADGRLIYLSPTERRWYALNFPQYPGNPQNFKSIMLNLEQSRSNLGDALSDFVFGSDADVPLPESVISAANLFEQYKDAYADLAISGLALDKRANDLAIEELDQATVDTLFLGNIRPKLKGKALRGTTRKLVLPRSLPSSLPPSLPGSLPSSLPRSLPPKTAALLPVPSSRVPPTPPTPTTSISSAPSAPSTPSTPSTSKTPLPKRSVVLPKLPSKPLASTSTTTSLTPSEAPSEVPSETSTTSSTTSSTLPAPISSDKLFFFSGSAAKPPGMGVNESGNPADYKELAAIPDWRKKLSNFWVAPINVDGKNWNTVEHYFQATKLAIANPEAANELSLDSGSELSKGDGDLARSSRKLIELNPQQLKNWDGMKSKVLEKGLAAKFSQHPELGQLLLATKNAQLWHGTPRSPKTQQVELERVRDTLAGKPAPTKKQVLITPRAPTSTSTSTSTTPTKSSSTSSSTSSKKAPVQPVVISLKAHGAAPMTSASTSPNPQANLRSTDEPSTIPPVPGVVGFIPTVAEVPGIGSVPVTETPASSIGSPSTGGIEVGEGGVGTDDISKMPGATNEEIQRELQENVREKLIQEFGTEIPSELKIAPAATANLVSTTVSVKPSAPGSSNPRLPIAKLSSVKPPTTSIKPKLPVMPPPVRRTSVAATSGASGVSATGTGTGTATTTTVTVGTDPKDYNKRACAKAPLSYQEMYRKLMPGRQLPNDKELICIHIENELKKMQQKGGADLSKSAYQFYKLSDLPDVESEGSEKASQGSSEGTQGTSEGTQVVPGTQKKPFDLLTTVVDAAKYLSEHNIPPEIKDTVINTIMNSETGKKLMPYMIQLQQSPELQEQLFSLLRMAYNDVQTTKASQV